jgi:hypothetical protein
VSPRAEPWHPDCVANVNLQARAIRTAAPDAAALVVSATDDAGKPITDLEAGDVSLRAVSAGPEALQVALRGLTARGDGIYAGEIAVVPPGAAWPPGEHVLAVSVRRVFDRGQCLAVLVIP